MRHSLACVVLIQRAWRQAVQCRRQLVAITRIQAQGRRSIARHQLFAAVTAAINIQRIWRGRKCRDVFLSQRRSTVTIQSTVRACLALCKIRRVLACVVLIQRAWREAVYWQKQNIAITRIQGQFRGSLARSRLFAAFAAATTIQRIWRGTECRNTFLAQHRSAAVVQSAVRARQARCRKLHSLASVVLIQQVWREAVQYHRQSVAITQIQAQCRGNLTRLRLFAVVTAAIAIQRIWRGRQCQDAFLSQRRSTVIVQSAVRACLARRNIRRLLACVVLIQRAWREAAHFRRGKVAMMRIQARCRGSLARRELFTAVTSSTDIQKIWRGRKCRYEFLSKRRSTINIQSAVRAFLARCKIHQFLACVVLIQRAWREAVYCRRRNTAITRIQGQLRGSLARRRLFAAIIAAVTIQRIWRGMECRTASLAQCRSAVIIQSAVRAHQARCHKRHSLASVVLIQKVWREAVQFRRRNIAITQIQAQCRRSLTRLRLFAGITAAINIQRIWRGKQCQDAFGARRRSTVAIQSAVRACQARCYKRQALASVTLIQEAWREAMHIHRRKVAIIRIQARCRGSLLKRRLLTAVTAAIEIQRIWRRRKCRDAFLSQRRSTVTIQSTVRAYLALCKVHRLLAYVVLIQRAWREAVYWQRQNIAITRIQRQVRGSLARRRLDAVVSAAIVIQRIWRGTECRNAFLSKRCLAVVMQSAVRAHLARCHKRHLLAFVVLIQQVWREAVQYHRQSVAITQIQAHCRGNLTRLRLFAAVTAAIAIQRIWRGRQCQDAFLSQRRLTVIVQSAVRARLARRNIQRLLACVVLIQRAWREAVNVRRRKVAMMRIQARCRGSLARREIFTAVTSSINIQKIWRGRKCRYEFLSKRRSTINIQSAVRAFLARCKIHQFLACVVLIQRAWREAVYCRRRNTAITRIQGQLRGSLARRRLFAETTAAVTIQRIWRGMECRTASLAQCRSAVIIQSAVRAHQARCHKRHSLASVVLIQKVWREAVQFRRRNIAITQIQAQCRRSLTRLRLFAGITAAINIQRIWRGKQCRDAFGARRRSTVAIQSAVRACQARCYKRQSLASVVLIQQTWRECLQFHRRKVAIMRIQARCRGCLTRRRLFAAVMAAINIERVWKGRKCRDTFLSRCRSTVAIQSAVRACHARCKVRHLLACAILIQGAWRQAINRRSVAITRIQAHLRGSLTRRHLFSANASAIAIQRLWKGTKCRIELLAHRRSSVIIQSAVRARQARCSIRHALACLFLIQCSWRKALHRHRQSVAITQIQALFRGSLARRHRFAEIASATAIQRVWRGGKCSDAFRLRRHSSITIQSAVRSHQARCHKRHLLISVAFIQVAWRKAINCHRQNVAITLIQAHCRGSLVRRHLFAEATSAITMQRVWRGKKCHDAFVGRRHSTVVIQSAVRACQVRCQKRKSLAAVVLIQQTWRGGLHYQRQNIAIKQIQAQCRGILARRNLLAGLTSAITIQSAWRGKKYRDAFLKWRHSTVTIQSAVRICQARFHKRHLLDCVVLIQQVWRGTVRCHMQNVAITHIQAHFRRSLLRRRFFEAVAAAIAIQRVWRRKMQRDEDLARRLSAIIIQSAVRACQARYHKGCSLASVIVIQQAWRGAVKCRRQNIAITIFQAHCRGRLTRSRFSTACAAAVLIQRMWRKSNIRNAFQAQLRSIVIAQSCVRGFQARCHVVRVFAAVVLIQRVVRGVSVRSQKNAAYLSITKIQAHFRGYLSKCQLFTAVEAAATIQRIWRERMGYRAFQALRRSTIIAQSVIRGYQARCHMVDVLAAVILIQRVWLICEPQCRQRRRNNAACTIQAHVRGYLSKRRLLAAAAAAIRIQRGWKRTRAHRVVQDSCRSTFPQEESPVRFHLRLDRRSFRGGRSDVLAVVGNGTDTTNLKDDETSSKGDHSYRSRGKELKIDFFPPFGEDTTTEGNQSRQSHSPAAEENTVPTEKMARIQVQCRGGLARRRVSAEIVAAVLIQRIWRGTRMRQAYQTGRRSTIIIQKAFRAFQAQFHGLRVRTAVVSIQKVWRGASCRRGQHKAICVSYNTKRRLIMGDAAASIQRVWRRSKSRRDGVVRRRSTMTITNGSGNREMRNMSREQENVRKPSAQSSPVKRPQDWTETDAIPDQPLMIESHKQKMIEVTPGVEMELRGSQETWEALRGDFYTTASCFGCSKTILCIKDAEFVLCPDCHTISPLEASDGFDKPRKGGLGLGLKSDDAAHFFNGRDQEERGDPCGKNFRPTVELARDFDCFDTAMKGFVALEGGEDLTETSATSVTERKELLLSAFQSNRSAVVVEEATEFSTRKEWLERFLSEQRQVSPEEKLGKFQTHVRVKEKLKLFEKSSSNDTREKQFKCSMKNMSASGLATNDNRGKVVDPWTNDRDNTMLEEKQMLEEILQMEPAVEKAAREHGGPPRKSHYDSGKPVVIEVAPGLCMRLHGSEETWDAVGRGCYVPASCANCNESIICIKGVDYVLCPDCRAVSRVESSAGGFSEPRGGLGLGLRYDDLIRFMSGNDSGTENDAAENLAAGQTNREASSRHSVVMRGVRNDLVNSETVRCGEDGLRKWPSSAFHKNEVLNFPKEKTGSVKEKLHFFENSNHEKCYEPHLALAEMNAYEKENRDRSSSIPKPLASGNHIVDDVHNTENARGLLLQDSFVSGEEGRPNVEVIGTKEQTVTARKQLLQSTLQPNEGVVEAEEVSLRKELLQALNAKQQEIRGDNVETGFSPEPGAAGSYFCEAIETNSTVANKTKLAPTSSGGHGESLLPWESVGTRSDDWKPTDDSDESKTEIVAEVTPSRDAMVAVKGTQTEPFSTKHTRFEGGSETRVPTGSYLADKNFLAEHPKVVDQHNPNTTQHKECTAGDSGRTIAIPLLMIPKPRRKGCPVESWFHENANEDSEKMVFVPFLITPTPRVKRSPVESWFQVSFQWEG